MTRTEPLAPEVHACAPYPAAGLVGACHVPVIWVTFTPLAPSEPLLCLWPWVISCKGLFNPRRAADRRLPTGGILKRSLFVACIARRDLTSHLIPAFVVHLWVPGFVIPHFGLLEHKRTGFSVKRFGRSPKGVVLSLPLPMVF